MRIAGLSAATFVLSLLIANPNAQAALTFQSPVPGDANVSTDAAMPTLDAAFDEVIGNDVDFSEHSADFQTLIESQPQDDASVVEVTLDDPAFIDQPITTYTPSDEDLAIHVPFDLENTGTVGSPTWLLYWQDLDLGPIATGHLPSDFTDLMIMSQTSTEGAIPQIAVPLPPAFFVGLVTIGIAAWFARRHI